MGEHIPGGGFIVARKIFNSNIWIKESLYLKVWIWIVGRASHSDHDKDGHYYKRGEFVTTYLEIIKATSHFHNREHIIPTLKKIRIILKWLENEGMIHVEPLKSGLGLTGADPRARTRAYVGIKIIVINYNTYQDSKNYKGRHKGRPSVQQGHNNNNGYNKGINPGEIFSLRERYSDQNLIDQAFKAIASTRKYGKVSDSILLKELRKWERYPIEHVETCIRIYMDKDCAGQGMDENYLLGIMRKHNKNSRRVQTSSKTPEWL
jgi:hypothetical protein